ncbi:trypsin-like serine peptidase [Sorangium sp. So ce513]
MRFENRPSFALKNRLTRGFLIALGVAASACSTTGLPVVNTQGIAENRQSRVKEVTPPQDAACRLQVIRKKAWLFRSSYFSSGAHIGSGIILTAGHNLYSSTFSVVDDVSVECGVTEHKDGAGRVSQFKRSSIAVLPGYDWKDFPRDIAIIRVPHPPAATFEVAPDDLQLKKGEEVHLSGFPGDGYTENGEFLFTARGKIVEVTPEFIVYAITTATGNSGGPVWMEKDGRFLVVGVHVSGEDDIGTARRVSQTLVNSLRNLLPASH